MRITHIVVHYTATYPDQNTTAADVNRMHKARGWKGIGYHWFIRRNGLIEPGRPESQVGAHVGGQNTGKIGIAWAGGIDRSTGSNVGVDNMTPEQNESLIWLIRDLLARYPGAKVVGHKDLAATQCPGFDVPVWWALVESITPPPPVPVSPDDPVETPNVNEQMWHVVQRGDTLWNISRMYNLELKTVLRLNNLDEDEPIVPGQHILLKQVDKPYIRGLIEWLRSFV